MLAVSFWKLQQRPKTRQQNCMPGVASSLCKRGSRGSVTLQVELAGGCPVHAPCGKVDPLLSIFFCIYQVEHAIGYSYQ